MFRLGYLDDDKGIRTTFARQFENDFEIVMFQDMDKISSLEDLLNGWKKNTLMLWLLIIYYQEMVSFPIMVTK